MPAVSILNAGLPQDLPKVTFSVFGSVLAFTAYVTALKTLPIKIVMTYTYVNPVIALLLGWAILGEQITWWMIGGMGLVLLGVWGVFRERYAGVPVGDLNRAVK